MEPQQSSFQGWAVVEMMGHRKEIGFVTTEAYDAAVMFRVDTPELPEREFALTRPEYVESEWMAAGTKVKRAATPARSCLVAPGSLYAMTPCSEEMAREAIERAFPRPLILIDRPAPKAIEAPDDEEDEDEEDDFEEETPDMVEPPAFCEACSLGSCVDHSPAVPLVQVRVPYCQHCNDEPREKVCDYCSPF